ncbi:AAA family ATPase [Methylobacterium sp.]|uniref:AAA family ATPase n=1 Tax=Methylobacterium sp. TaxID=409 RepID=UPI00260005CE|nr:AAA family ATPase [Methylobacterium sp.]MBY0260124.1 AAA family ATPase [Methylobacterium sp.]
MISPFASIGHALSAQGYSPIPIMPGEKAPGIMVGVDWRHMRGWNKFCEGAPSSFQVGMWSKWARAGVGVACGRGLIGLDLDRDEIVEPIRAVVPEVVVAKRGRKGATFFFRGDTSAIVSRGYKIDGLGVMDVISHGKQTVLPPSIHAVTGLPYEWTTERTLADTPLAELAELTVEHMAAVIEVLKSFGYQPEPEIGPSLPREIDEDGDAEFYRQLNNDALASLGAWVPKLGLSRLQRSGDGFRSVAEWRPSNSGNPLHKRPLLLAIKPNGIVDFGGGDKGYTPLNLVMEARGADLDQATRWLGEAIGQDFSPEIVLNRNRNAVASQRCNVPLESAYREARDGLSEPVDDQPDPFADIGLPDDRVARRPKPSHEPENDAAMSGPTPFEWTDPDRLPRRDWLYGNLLIRKEVSATLAPGGVGKTSLGIVEALALASGKKLLDIAPKQRCNVWIWNGEEPMEEMQRRIMAACRHFGLTPSDIDGHLFVDTADTLDLVLATETKSGALICRPLVNQLAEWVSGREIDAIFIDPFISTHNVNENDNNAIQKATTAWKDVARLANAAVSIAHHTRKLAGRDATAEDSRGAKSFSDKCRVARPLNPMSKDEAERFGIPIADRRFFFSFDPTEAKMNMSAAVGGKQWFRSVSVALGKGQRGNLDPGDSVGVVERWEPPSLAAPEMSDDRIAALAVKLDEQEWRAAANLTKEADWVGAAVAEVFDLDLSTKTGLAQVKALLGRLIDDGTIVRVSVRDPASRKPRPIAMSAARASISDAILSEDGVRKCASLH